jgi:hypothetical protein
MRKGGRLPELGKLRVVKRCLKVLDGFLFCQKYLVLAFGHFKGIDEDHRWHGYAPFVRDDATINICGQSYPPHPRMVIRDAEDVVQEHTGSSADRHPLPQF